MLAGNKAIKGWSDVCITSVWILGFLKPSVTQTLLDKETYVGFVVTGGQHRTSFYRHLTCNQITFSSKYTLSFLLDLTLIMTLFRSGDGHSHQRHVWSGNHHDA